MAIELSDRTKTVIKWLGFVLSLVAVGFVIAQFVQYWEEMQVDGLGRREWLALGALGLAYAVFSILLALAWWKMLLHLDTQSTPHWAVYAYGFSQLGKYLPGNVFHFAGRHVMGMAAGHMSSSLIYSTVLELVLLVVSGLLVSIMLLPLLGLNHWLVLGAYGLGLTLVCSVLKLRTTIHLSHAVMMHSIFLIVSGIIFVLVLALISTDLEFGVHTAMMVLAAYVVAWLVGLVTPGAPAGMGIRELVLLFLLGPWVSQGDLLLAVLLSRVVSLMGDLLFFALAVGLKSPLTARGMPDD